MSAAADDAQVLYRKRESNYYLLRRCCCCCFSVVLLNSSAKVALESFFYQGICSSRLLDVPSSKSCDFTDQSTGKISLFKVTSASDHNPEVNRKLALKKKLHAKKLMIYRSKIRQCKKCFLPLLFSVFQEVIHTFFLALNKKRHVVVWTNMQLFESKRSICGKIIRQ